jgi:hypothetical protein
LLAAQADTSKLTDTERLAFQTTLLAIQADENALASAPAIVDIAPIPLAVKKLFELLFARARKEPSGATLPGKLSMFVAVSGIVGALVGFAVVHSMAR